MGAPQLPKTPQEEDNGCLEILHFNPVLTVIMLLAAALLGWTVSLIPVISSIQTSIGLAEGILAAIFLLTFANIRGSRSAMVIKTVAGTFLSISTLIMIGMAIFCTNVKAIFITSSFIALIYIIIAYSVARTRQ